MMDPRPVQKDMLVGLAELRMEEQGLHFERARETAQQYARAALTAPMLLAWFDKKAWKHSPPLC
jgi:hypothetical protein